MRRPVFASFDPEIDGSLKRISRIGVGGKADFIIRVGSKDEFIRLSRLCRENGKRLITIGHGSNLFFSDGRIKGVVAVLGFSGIRLSGEKGVVVQAGAGLSSLIEFSFANSLSGLETFAGIPGTVGGAIFGNAGAYGSEIGSRLRRAEILTSEGETVIVDRDYFRFGYRDSILKRNRAVVLEAEFELARGDEATLRSRAEEIVDLRNRKLPPEEVLTAGSYFKNLCLESGERKAAAFYLEAAGSKDCAVGDAYVFPGHANIICNRGGCSAGDILRLEQMLVARVANSFGITLEREVIYVE